MWLYSLEAVLKPHLRPNGCVVPRIEILTYYRVRSVFNSRDAVPLNLIWSFKTTSSIMSHRVSIKKIGVRCQVSGVSSLAAGQKPVTRSKKPVTRGLIPFKYFCDKGIA